MSVSTSAIKHGFIKSLCNLTELSVNLIFLTRYPGVTLTGQLSLSTSLHCRDAALSTRNLSCIRL